MSTAAGAAAAAKAELAAAKAAAGAALKQQRAALEAERDQQQQQEQQVNVGKVQEVAAGRDKARRAQVTWGAAAGFCSVWVAVLAVTGAAGEGTVGEFPLEGPLKASCRWVNMTR